MSSIFVRKFIYGSVAICGLMMLTSCATAPVTTVPPPAGPATMYMPKSVATSPATTGAGMYHSVAPGETLWRIAKMYDVKPDTIKKANRIIDPTNIKIGQRLYIPNAHMRKNLLTLYPSEKWEYIIIHHSATDWGSSTKFHEAHKKRGWQSVGYHFVIDNGTVGTEDGQIETTPRWINQTDGAHCKAGGMNARGIGICLVGNFSNSAVSGKQMDSLVFLVRELQEFYDIPSSRVIGHGDVPGAKTECPGKDFPWRELRRRLN